MYTISLILNMIAFVYILNICEYDVSNMYIMHTCMLCIILCLSVSIVNMIFLVYNYFVFDCFVVVFYLFLPEGWM